MCRQNCIVPYHDFEMKLDCVFAIGVEHVGGDMFVSVPKGDAIFMKVSLNQLEIKLCFTYPIMWLVIYLESTI